MTKSYCSSKSISGLVRLPNHDIFGHAMVLTIPVPVDDSDPGSRRQRSSQVTQQSDWLGDLVICLQQQNGVNLCR